LPARRIPFEARRQTRWPTLSLARFPFRGLVGIQRTSFRSNPRALPGTNAAAGELEQAVSRMGCKRKSSYTFSRNLTTDPLTSVNGKRRALQQWGSEQSENSAMGPDFFWFREHRAYCELHLSVPQPEEPLILQRAGSWGGVGESPAVDHVFNRVISFWSFFDPNGPKTIFGQSADRASLSAACTKGHYRTPGPVTSNLDAYIGRKLLYWRPARFSPDDPQRPRIRQFRRGEFYDGPGQKQFRSVPLPRGFPNQLAARDISSFSNFARSSFNAFKPPRQFCDPDVDSQFIYIRADLLHECRATHHPVRLENSNF